VEVCDRKLYKQMRAFEHRALTKFDSKRDPFTKHGLHVNNKEKVLAAKKNISTIKYVLKKQKNQYV
jgi:hypothetical protein